MEREICAHLAPFMESLQVVCDACRRLHCASVVLLALHLQSACLRVAQRLEQWTLHQGECRVCGPLAQGRTCGIAGDALFEIFGQSNPFAYNEGRQQRFSRLDMQVEHTPVDSGFSGDIVDGGLVRARAQDQVGGRVERTPLLLARSLSGACRLTATASCLASLSQRSSSLVMISLTLFIKMVIIL